MLARLGFGADWPSNLASIAEGGAGLPLAGNFFMMSKEQGL
jgi:hypothetical protein